MISSMPKSDLPFGSEFSPSQIELATVLRLSKKYGGNWQNFEDAVRAEYFEDHKTSEYNRRKLANNTKLGMIAYGIIDRDAKLTQFGETLYALRQDQAALHKALGRHILLNLQGVALIQCVQDIQASSEVVMHKKLREWLKEREILDAPKSARPTRRDARSESSTRLFAEEG